MPDPAVVTTEKEEEEGVGNLAREADEWRETTHRRGGRRVAWEGGWGGASRRASLVPARRWEASCGEGWERLWLGLKGGYIHGVKE